MNDLVQRLKTASFRIDALGLVETAATMDLSADRLFALTADMEWRRQWHVRLGRGTATEGLFYERLEALAAALEGLVQAAETTDETAVARALAAARAALREVGRGDAHMSAADHEAAGKRLRGEQ